MLASAACLALLAAAPDVESRTQLELKVHGEFALVAPGKPARFKAAGPGRMVAYVLAKKRLDDEPPEVNIEVFTGGASVFKEHLVTARLPGLVAAGAKNDFGAGGLKRVTFELSPKTKTYEFRANAPTAVAAFRAVQAPPGVRVPEIPVKPEGRTKPLSFVQKERWHRASICDHVTVITPGSGALMVRARTQLSSDGDLPPPTFLRALFEGKVKGAFPITSAPEQGLEFVGTNGSHGAGTVREMTMGIPAAGEYDFELAAWGCINGVGLQFDFAPGEVPPAAAGGALISASTLGGTAPLTDAQLPNRDGGSTELAQCGLEIDEAARARALEYLDTMVESGVIPPSQLTLEQAATLGDSFLIQSVWYALDGAVLFEKKDAAPETAPSLAQRRVVPGPHTLEVKATLRGRGAGPFSYLNDYIIRLSKREAFVAESGKKYGLKATYYDKGGFGTPFKERAGLKVELLPEN